MSGRHEFPTGTPIGHIVDLASRRIGGPNGPLPPCPNAPTDNPTGGPAAGDLADLVAQIVKLTIDEWEKRLLAVKMADTFSDVTYSELAKIQLSTLKKKNTYIIFEPIAREKESVLTEAEQSSLLSLPSGIPITKTVSDAAKHESYLCMKMTRYLQRLFHDEDLLLVNSEEYKWIVTVTENRENFMKPDFFLIRRGLQLECNESGSEIIRTLRKLPENNDVTYSFGKLSDWCLRDCVLAVIEFKMKLAAEDFGKLVCYLQHLSRNDNASTYYGMVCDNKDVWLVSCTAGNANTRVDTTWTCPGSAQLIRGFFSNRNDWCSVLDHCCAVLKVKLSASSSFLGRGAKGRVFKVVTEDGRQCAMKIIFSEKAVDLTLVQAELASLRSIKAICGNTVTVVGKPAYYRDPLSNMISGIGYLMEEVGTVILPEDCSGNRQLTEEVLRELYHLHRQRRYHGDPQLTNLIRHNGKLLWIDFMRVNLETPSETDFPEFVKHDVKTLLHSMMRVIDDSVLSSLNSYAADPSDVTVANLISAVLAV